MLWQRTRTSRRPAPAIAGPPAAAVVVPPFLPIVVAPTHNNAGTLREVLDALSDLDLPVLVVDDGSTDATPKLLAKWVAAGADRTVVRHPVNRGKAAALRTDFEHARRAGYTHAATIDTDGQLSAADVPVLLDRAERRRGALVLGVRDATAPDYPIASRVGRWVSNKLVWFETGLTVADSQCGLRVYPLEFAANAHCDAERFGFETQVLTRAAWTGIPVVEVPVACQYFPRCERVSHFRPFVDSLRALGMHAGLLSSASAPFLWRRAKLGTVPPLGRSALRRMGRWLNPVTAWRQVRQTDAGRTRFAAGFATGVFIGNLPVYGAQTLLSLFVARRFHLHPVSVVAGTNVSMPPVGPLLIVGGITIGHLMLHGTLPSRAMFNVTSGHWAEMLRPLLCEWIIGAIVLGAAMAGVTFVGLDCLLRALHDPTPPSESP